MPSTIRANIACDPVQGSPALADTCDLMISRQIPNLLRLYLNPYVVQASFCLTEAVAAAWPEQPAKQRQVFLANSEEEALSGAVKLARYAANAEQRSNRGLIVDTQNRWTHFASTALAGQPTLEYLPNITLEADLATAARILTQDANDVGFVVVTHEDWDSPSNPLRVAWNKLDAKQQRPLLIVCTSLEMLNQSVEQPGQAAPDIVVFDESFTNHEVPFGAFVASKRLFGHWSGRGKSTFHSTTFQPNTISSLHLMRSLRELAPGLVRPHEAVLTRIERDEEFRQQLFADLYSKPLAKLMNMVGFDQTKLRVDGHYIADGQRKVFDAVAGVACSIRGHNPLSYVCELAETGEADACRAEVVERLGELTGMPHVTPAVSGASAVEQALKFALASRPTQDYVLALRGGFGGKTLFALTGTWRKSLKTGLTPLYSKVVYVDPFAENATEQIAAAFAAHPIGVVQCELVQGVGGVRPIPEQVVDCLQQMRGQHDCLLFVDEVQTGVYRTGPFTRSTALGIEPDLLTIGKSLSDMVFPFAMTLHNEKVQRRLDELGCRLPEHYRARHDYEFGYRTVLNTLRRAHDHGLENQVHRQGQLLAENLSERLKHCRQVREVRCFGLLAGIELRIDGLPSAWLKKLMPRLYLLGMTRRQRFPVLVGFCQYEPHVLKLTPPLSITDREISELTETIGSVLEMSPVKLILQLTKQTLSRTKPENSKAK